LQPHQVQKLSFMAPKQPGVYPYVCTYPGHWRRMYGALYVVEDLDEALANPETYLTKINLPIKDELLKDRRPRTEWKFADLEESVKNMKSGRSYTNGKQIFTVASCISCHKMEGAGQEFGPDLTKLDPKYTNVDILKHILEPSEKIDAKYKSYTIVDLNGKTYTGMILEETKKEVKLIENPLTKAEPILIKIEDIDRRRESPVSLMPKGLFDKLTKEEILDLIAYVASKTDKKSPLFQPGDGHHHH
jgi:putative heme-binding domain-containing protein